MYKFKTWLCFILSLALLCSLLPGFALTADAAASGSCGANLTWTFDSDTNALKIEGSGGMYDYSAYGTPWYRYHTRIASVSLPNGLTGICEYAFLDCTALTSAVIPGSVESIGSEAFAYCSALTSVTIPDGVKSIGYGAFEGSAITSVTIPNSVTEIGRSAFAQCVSLTGITVASGNPYYCSLDGVLFNKARNELIQYPAGKTAATYTIPNGVTSILADSFMDCSALVNVTIPNTVTRIGNYAFRNCSALTSAVIPEGVTNIERCTFENCTALTGVTLPNSLTSIEEYAFDNCTALTGITFPSSLTELNDSALSGCTALAEIHVASGNPNYSSIGGVLFNQNGTELKRYPAGKPDTEYATPGGVTVIGAYAFDSCIALKKMTISAGVTSIGSNAFIGCASLESVTIPNTVTKLASYAFYGCSVLKSITIPGSVAHIGESSFGNCTSLTSVTIQSGAASIDGYAFYGCKALTSLTIPNTLTSIGVYAFVDCTALMSVVIPSSVTDIGTHALGWKNSDNQTSQTPIKDGGHQAPIQGFTIYGYSESAAETYAKKLSHIDYFVFVPLDPSSGFCDVSTTAYYYQPMLWALENGITNGTSAVTFSPKKTCTRGQVVSFLWNAMGKPEPDTSDNPFVDVKPSKYYYKAVLWAYQTGVTKGADDTHFNPSGKCNRAQVVSFLWNTMGKPEPTGTDNPFLDVKPGKYYYKAVLWAVENGITKGADATHFAPNQTCTRGQVVTFLYNTLA